MAAPNSLIHEAVLLNAKRTTISLTYPVSQREVGKGFLLTTFSLAYPFPRRMPQGAPALWEPG